MTRMQGKNSTKITKIQKKTIDVLKTILLYYYSLMMAQACGLNSSRLINISINVCQLWLEIF